MFDLQGKVAIVTGGYGYLGKAMVKALARFGATVIVAARSKEKFAAAFSEEEGFETTIRFHFLDITATDSFRALYSETFETFNRIDVIVNNAFVTSGNQPEQLSDENWATTLEGSLASIHKSIRESIPYFRKTGGGKIVNISSMYGMVSPDFNVYRGGECEQFINPPHYGASKAAVLQLTRYYAAYLGPENIQVNCLTPGPFPAPAVQEKNPEFIRRLSGKTMLNRIGRPDDLAGAIVLLSSPASDFITGHSLVVDGGWTAL